MFYTEQHSRLFFLINVFISGIVGAAAGAGGGILVSLLLFSLYWIVVALVKFLKKPLRNRPSRQ